MYQAKVEFKLTTKFLIEGENADEAKANAVRQLQDKHKRRPDVGRKLKTTYKNAVATGAVLSKAPFFKVDVDADVCQMLNVYAENNEAAADEAARQVVAMYRERPNQISFASDISVCEVVKVSQ